MKSRILSYLLPMSFLCLATVSRVLGAAPTVGEPAPTFELKDYTGKAHSPAKHRGQYIVLEWTNPECPFVKKQYDGGNMQTLQKEWTAKGVVWLAIDSSAPGNEGNLSGSAAEEASKGQYSSATHLLLDSDGTVGKLYSAKTTPHMFVINPEGKLIYAGAIDSIPSTNPTDISKATNYVNQALTEAMEGKPVSVPTSKPYGCGVKYGQ